MKRRDFLRQGGAVTGGAAGALGSLRLLHLRTAAQGVPNDYKALVCIFLYGGNDSHNLIVPTGETYADYAAARSFLAVPPENILPLTPQTPDGRAWGMPNYATALHALFEAGSIAAVLNTGSLQAPFTRADYLAGGRGIQPKQLFSHKEGQEQWQTSIAQDASSTGWGGRLADYVDHLNGNSSVSMSISLGGTNVFEVGREVFQYGVGPEGSVGLEGFDDSTASQLRRQTFDSLLNAAHSNLLERAYADTVKRGIESHEVLENALASLPPLTTSFPATGLASQLHMVARLISARSGLGLKRQIFFVSMGGFDTHWRQNDVHPGLLATVSAAMGSFHEALVELGVSEHVTTFTASDFGRTLSVNGRGSDHGWGGHHLVMGGAVQGGAFYGTMPRLIVGGPDDTSRGRFIPSTSVDEYAATFATWFGVPDRDLEDIVPNLGRFPNRSLGFLG